MTGPTAWDHAFALAVFVFFPLLSAWRFPTTIRNVRQRGEAARLQLYRHVILTWLIFSGFLVGLWWALDRDWQALGIRGTEPGLLLAGLAVAVVAILLVVAPIRKIAMQSEDHTPLVRGLGDVFVMMPVSRMEEAWFRAVSFNAGVTEELIYRGYLMWYLESFLATGWAAAVAIVAFGMAHLYQGISQLPGILLVSAVAVGLYLLTGSLLLPVLFHITLDVLQGHYLARLRRRPVAA